MFNIESISGNNVLLITHNNKIILINNIDSEDLCLKTNVYEHSAELTSVTFLKNKNLLAFTDINKKFYLIDISNNNSIITTNLIKILKRVVNKRGSKIITNKEESVVILGDKTGDVYSLKLDPTALESSQFKLIMGHLSMLTDMNLSLDEKYLFTSDRDEKIRISHYPNTYNIHSFMLAHKEFVSQIEFLDEEYLLSASGDSSVILWNLKQINPIQTLNIKDLYENKAKIEELRGIDRFDFNSRENLLLVHPFEANFLFSYNYDEIKNRFEFKERLNLSDEIQLFVRVLDNYYLFAFLDENAQAKFVMKKLNENNLLDIDSNTENVLDKVVKSIEAVLLENFDMKQLNDIREEIKNNYLGYFKSKVDNINEYYEKKQERIMAINTKKQKLSDSKNESYTNLATETVVL